MQTVVHTYRVALEAVQPLVWRRIRVPASYSFWDLHVAIQDAMGWLDTHLHVFSVLNPSNGNVDAIGIPDEDSYLEDEPCRAGWEVPIMAYFIQPGDSAEYTYDFGDDWRHTVTLESVTELPQGESALQCLAGARACPPEDSGGPHGYRHLVAVLGNPGHREYREMSLWLEEGFDPERFDAASVSFDDPRARWRLAFGD